ncbi:MAG: alpha-galactosidase [Lentisphaeria bacterium]|nr:alpha-galactosidase [Lentisphaeria bacterium]
MQKHLLSMLCLTLSVQCAVMADVTPQFSFTYRDNEYTGIPSGWKKERKSLKNKGFRTEITTATEPDGVTLILEKTVYAKHPVVEWSLSFENRSQQDTGRFTRISSAYFTIPFGKNESVTMWKGIGEAPNPPDNYSFTRIPMEDGKTVEMSPFEGYPSFNAFPYFRVYSPKRGYTVALGWEGQWHASIAKTTNGISIRGGQQTVDFFLKPGEKVITPRITVLTYKTEDDAVNLWRKWFREFILPREADGQIIRPRLVADGHEHGELYCEITCDRQIELVKLLRERGLDFDSWWIDAGWYIRELLPNPPIGQWFLVGDWTPDPKRFPKMFKPLSDELAREGSELVLWYEPERVHEKSPILPEISKYLAPPNHILSKRYDLSNPEAVDYLIKTIGKSLQDNGVSFYRQDSNGAGPIHFWMSTESTLNDGRRGMVENKAIQGMFRFWDGLKQAKPNLLIDVCASGGRRNDLETLRQGAVPLHYSDVGYEDFISKQRYHHLLNQWFLYYKNIAQHCYDGGKLNQWKSVIDIAPFHTVYAPSFLREDNSAERKWNEVCAKVTPYQVDADYYLLTPEIFGIDQWWVCQFHDPATQTGILQVVRNEKNTDDTLHIELKGIRANRPLHFEDLYAGEKFASNPKLDLKLAPGTATVLIYSLSHK